MSQLQVDTSVEVDRLVVALAGECDLTVSAQLTDALLSAVGRSATVVVDLAGLTFLDSSGVHALVTAHHAAAARDGRIYLVNATGVVAHVLDLTGVAELLARPAGADRDG